MGGGQHVIYQTEGKNSPSVFDLEKSMAGEDRKTHGLVSSVPLSSGSIVTILLGRSELAGKENTWCPCSSQEALCH
jgi:hypothetical protein